MYENTSYGGRKRCKDCTVLNRLRERDASPDRVNVCWQSGDRQSDVLEMIVMKSWHYSSLLNRSFDEVRNERRRETLYDESRLISVKFSLQMSGINLKHIFWMLQFLSLVLLVASVACLLVVNVACLLVASVACLLVANIACLLVVNVAFLCKMSVACICCVFCSRLAVMIV